MSLLLLSIAYADGNCLLDSCSKPSVKHPQAISVKEESLVPCSQDPITGFFRDSYCRTGEQDRGIHVVCGVMTFF